MNEKDYSQYFIRISFPDFSLSYFNLSFMVLTLILTSWLAHLIIRPAGFANYVAFVAATFFPASLGCCNAALSWIQSMNTYYGGGPGPPTMEDVAWRALIANLIVGPSLTCLFLPLGLALLWVHKPKVPAGETPLGTTASCI